MNRIPLPRWGDSARRVQRSTTNTSTFAAKITRIEDCAWAQESHPGAKTLWMDDVDAKAHLIPEWVRIHNPQVGGYFVVTREEDGTTKCEFQPGAAFERDFRTI